MSLLDFLTGKIECPRCGTRGAKEIKGQIHCPNPTCSYFSKTMGKGKPAPAKSSPPLSLGVDANAGYSAGPRCK